MKWIILAGALLSAAALADERSFETPEVRCLNDHIIPLIKSDIEPKKIVDEVYVTCKSELDEWKKSQEPLPVEMKLRMRKEFYDFYIRMIEKRRNYEASKSAKAVQ
ncbi:hypothetical protein NGC37_03735 [Pantoea anthophila]|uniref:hypothetical protein n=1 Tax=Pantoea anthophila TaxID=470931 RepID=UPI002DB6A906|nr:hypothetical protein [Pantoea anthophila]MEB7537420.1 hypothetical protein [Pantoea anthophila]